MSTVNTEGKLNWYLGIELSLRSLGAYLQLGFSLGAVQLRHACVPYHLATYHATCLWRRRVTHCPEDGVLYLEGTERETIANKTLNGSPVEHTTVTRPVSAQASGPVNPHAFLAELLAKFDALAAITHGEAADEKLLTRMMQQDLLVQEHRAARRAAGLTVADGVNGEGDAQPHASEESVVFRMSESDASYGALRAAGHPVAITYRDFVNLTTLLSEAIAWDLLWIHEALDRREKAETVATASSATPPASPTLPSPPPPSLHRMEADCVAVMLPNSVEYNAVWMAAARSGPLHTFLDVLYRNSNHITGSGNRGGTYRPCRTALLNTNLASNAMLYHAIECAGSVILLMDAAYVPLLFRTPDPEGEGKEEDGKEAAASPQLHVPPQVKRIYLWRCSTSNGEPLHKTMTAEMVASLQAFNAAAYDSDGPAVATGRRGHSSAHDSGEEPVADPLPPPPPPPLDLFDSVKVYYARAQASPSFTVRELRHTYLISSPRARLLVHHILARPPPGWKSLLALELNTVKSSQRRKTPAAPQTTAVDSAQSRAQLEHYKAKMASILSVLLRRFHHTQPVLFIYTSGTTGLPKAARFSHLRFFATGFLSRVLYYRDRVAETVVEQYDEVAYVAANPDAVQRYATLTHAAPPLSSATPTNRTVEKPPGEADPLLKTSTAGASAEGSNGCVPPIPQLFGAKVLDATRHRRNTVEATLIIICNVVLWWVRYLASFCGLEYYVTRAAERWWYTPAQLAAIEEERRLVTIYNCLPMYHTVGSVFCLGHLLHALEEQQYAWAQMRHGAAANTRLAATVPTVRMVLRTKFSASQFRRDLQRYHVTVVQYIGEVLRYAVLYERSHAPAADTNMTSTSASSSLPSVGGEGAMSPAAAEAVALAAQGRATWRVPYAFGNGLRQDIWLECMRRLNLAHPVEFYSSTEGNIFLLNLFGMPGVIGHIPRFPPPIAWLSMQYFPIFPFRVLKFDEQAQEIYRDPQTGYCAHCPVGEVGEVVGEVIEGFDMFALRRFDGYHKANAAARASASGDAEEDAVARQKKVIRHVLWPYTNDCYFLSGDLIRMDRYGFCGFVDRVGDTFRWKGENVSTLEVSNALNSLHTTRVGVQEAVVYGVQLPGREGRAGMAMLRLQRSHVHTSASGHSGKAERTNNDTTAADTPPSPAPSSSSSAVSLADERRFLQTDLYGFLSGKVARNGDGTANQATLPAYAVPLFIRMQDPLPAEEAEAETETDSGSTAGLTTTNPPPSATSPAAKKATEDATQTTTFKYKRGVLIKQGYDFAGSSAISADVPAEGWGSAADAVVFSTTYTRVYVLVTNPAVFHKLALTSEEAAGAAASGAQTVSAGYVPLTPAARMLLGENMDKCGW